MPSVAAEAMAAAVVADSTVVEAAVRSVAAEASAEVDSAAVMAEASGEDMAASVTADGDAATGAAGALDWDGDGVGPVTLMDTLTMDILTLMDIRVITDTIPTLIADSKHTDPLLLTKRHLALTAVR